MRKQNPQFRQPCGPKFNNFKLKIKKCSRIRSRPIKIVNTKIKAKIRTSNISVNAYCVNQQFVLDDNQINGLPLILNMPAF